MYWSKRSKRGRKDYYHTLGTVGILNAHCLRASADLRLHFLDHSEVGRRETLKNIDMGDGMGMGGHFVK
jgi:hypothetical protein